MPLLEQVPDFDPFSFKVRVLILPHYLLPRRNQDDTIDIVIMDIPSFLAFV